MSHLSNLGGPYLLLKLTYKDDKAGKMLAHKLKQTENMHSILVIKSMLYTDSTSINSAFKHYYSNLYTSELKASEQDLNTF